jgi:quercetin dioxygenase-like cupin family protein
MIRTGQTIENPATGERLTFRQTSRDTGGEYVVVETALQPGATVAAAHVHPYQTERFEVVEGTVGLQVGREKVDSGPGEVVTVEPGVAHRFYNAGSGEARFLCRISPALGFEELIEAMFGLAADGKTSRKGMPNPLRLQSSPDTTSTTFVCPSFPTPCSARRLPWARLSAGLWATAPCTSPPVRPRPP